MSPCRHCGWYADTTQHLLPKSCTEPQYYIRLPLCKLCHNFGQGASDSVGQRLLNSLENESIGSFTKVNGITASVIAGSALPGIFVPIPEGAFSAHFKNMATGNNNDFRLTSTGSSFFASGSAFGTVGYVGYIILAKTISM